MKFIGFLIAIASLLLGLFLFANWAAITTQIQLSFLLFEANGSVGLIFLGITLVFALLFVSYALLLRTRMLVDARRHAQELDAQRKLAESAETSRYDQLREQITAEFAQLQKTNKESHDTLVARNETMEQSLLKQLEEETNGLSAALGEIEEKLDRVLARNAA